MLVEVRVVSGEEPRLTKKQAMLLFEPPPLGR
jgi:hypothetical protein